jgi:5-oxoprolinase (ATP-hydrolysing) subunit C
VSALRIIRAGPLCTIQDAGRFGMLQHGISASGPMDRGAWDHAGELAGGRAGAAVEFTAAGLAFTVDGTASLRGGCAGGSFALRVNGNRREWPARLGLGPGDTVDISPGPAGNYGYLRLDRELDVPPVLGSRSTNLVVGLGGLKGRALQAGDSILLGPAPQTATQVTAAGADDGAIRFIWGLHADMFGPLLRRKFVESGFFVSKRIDRMGARLEDRSGVFAGRQILSLVSEAIVPGDIQILGDGTPIILLRDHQPTGGYPRIGTVISADLDRVAQLRPGTELRFEPVSVAKAQAGIRGRWA